MAHDARSHRSKTSSMILKSVEVTKMVKWSSYATKVLGRERCPSRIPGIRVSRRSKNGCRHSA